MEMVSKDGIRAYFGLVLKGKGLEKIPKLVKLERPLLELFEAKHFSDSPEFLLGVWTFVWIIVR